MSMKSWSAPGNPENVVEPPSHFVTVILPLMRWGKGDVPPAAKQTDELSNMTGDALSNVLEEEGKATSGGGTPTSRDSRLKRKTCIQCVN